jgi:hypothetical protein
MDTGRIASVIKPLRLDEDEGLDSVAEPWAADDLSDIYANPGEVIEDELL